MEQGKIEPNREAMVKLSALRENAKYFIGYGTQVFEGGNIGFKEKAKEALEACLSDAKELLVMLPK